MRAALHRIAPGFQKDVSFRSLHAYPVSTNTKAVPRLGFEPKVVSAAEAVSNIPSGSSIFVHGHAATPTELLDALCDRIDRQQDSKFSLQHIIFAGKCRWEEPKYYGKIRSNCFFICDHTRKAVADGAADYVPVFLSDIGRIFRDGHVPLDYGFVSLSPPDEHGNCSLGVDVDVALAGANAAKKLIGLVNSTMPRTLGDCAIHKSQLEFLVHTDRPIYGKNAPIPVGDAEKKIGKLIAENLVDNGATLQFGIGGIPAMTIAAMTNHKDLGIHTEMLSDEVMELVDIGVINNQKKTVLPGKMVTSFAYGSRKFYDTINNNPLFHFAPACWTNHTDVIRRQSKMTAINACLEVDITGQVCSDSIGERLYSGFGGQVDFITSASNTYDGMGKGILAMTSRTESGKSKISATLKQGGGVVTTRAHVHYLVTEYGIASLFGKNVRQRAHQLINISHPDDRESLEKAAFQRLKVMPSSD